MTLDNPRSGLGYAAEFQSSALPWVTSSTAPAVGSPIRLDFPKITRAITISNRDTSSNTLSFGFTRAGVVSTGKKYVLNAGQSITVEMRVKELWLQGETGTPNYSVIAGLTNISAREMPLLSGTLSDGSPGWIGVD
jgi:hypothetical protein